MGPNVNDKFPNLVGSTQYSDDFDLYEYLGDSWGLLFLHPGDFTPVCTTELGAVAFQETEFSNRKIKVCGFSCNDGSSHRQWLRDIEYATGVLVEFPLFCDPTREYSKKLNVLDRDNLDAKGRPLTARGVYILKPNKTIALTMMYPASTGRNIEEIIRCIDSVQAAGKTQQEKVLRDSQKKLEALSLCGDNSLNNSAHDKGLREEHKSGRNSARKPDAALFDVF